MYYCYLNSPTNRTNILTRCIECNCLVNILPVAEYVLSGVAIGKDKVISMALCNIPVFCAVSILPSIFSTSSLQTWPATTFHKIILTQYYERYHPWRVEIHSGKLSLQTFTALNSPAFYTCSKCLVEAAMWF